MKSLSSYSTLQSAIKDPFLRAKVKFFISVSQEVEPFLRRFQSSKPLAVFLYKEYGAIIRNLAERVVKPEVLKPKEGPELNFNQICLLDLKDSDILLTAKKVNIGPACKSELKNLKEKEKDVLVFRQDCRDFLVAMLQKLNERSPLKYPCVRTISCFDPDLIFFKPNLATTRFEQFTQLMLDHRQIDTAGVENATKQFRKLVYKAKKEVKFSKIFESWDMSSDELSLDSFYAEILTPKNFPNGILDLKMLVHKALILSHGQAHVESGFSVNETFLSPNLHEESLVNLRRISDTINFYGRVLDVPISKKMLTACRLSRSRYRQALEESKKSQEASYSNEERKRKLLVEELKEIKKKQKLTEWKNSNDLEQLSMERRRIETQLSHM